MHMEKNKLTNILLILIAAALIIIIVLQVIKKQGQKVAQNEVDATLVANQSATSTPADKGGSKDLPKMYMSTFFTFPYPANVKIETENQSETGPIHMVNFSDGTVVSLVTNSTFFEQYELGDASLQGTKTFGLNTFKIYKNPHETFYWLKKNNLGYKVHLGTGKFDLSKFSFVNPGTPANSSNTITPANYSSDDPHFSTAITQGSNQTANFAGHYTIVSVGCGSSCGHVYLYDKNDGTLYALPANMMNGALGVDGTTDNAFPINYSIGSNVLTLKKKTATGVFYEEQWKLSGKTFEKQ